MNIKSRAYFKTECGISTKKLPKIQEKGHRPSSENVSRFPEIVSGGYQSSGLRVPEAGYQNMYPVS